MLNLHRRDRLLEVSSVAEKPQRVPCSDIACKSDDTDLGLAKVVRNRSNRMLSHDITPSSRSPTGFRHCAVDGQFNVAADSSRGCAAFTYPESTTSRQAWRRGPDTPSHAPLADLGGDLIRAEVHARSQ